MVELEGPETLKSRYEIHRRLWLGPKPVIGVTIDRSNDAAGIDHESARHGQRPSVNAVVPGKINTEVAIHLDEVLGQVEREPELFRQLAVVIPQDVKVQLVLLDHRAAVLGSLRRDQDQRGTEFLELSGGSPQSIQLCIAVGSPLAAKETHHERSLRQKVRRAHRSAACVLEVERRHAVADF